MSATKPGFHTSISEGVATLTFSRPEVGNAISPEMVAPLIARLSALSSDASVRCLVIRGEGKHFSTGGDVAQFATMLDNGPDALRATFSERLAATAHLVAAVIAVPQPVVAVVRGGVAGAGLMFTLGADIVLADDTATFLFSHQRIGLSPDGGVSWLLPRIVGRRAAALLVLTAARVGAERATELGLVSEKFSAEELDDECDRLVRRLAAAPNGAVRQAKALLRSAGEVGLAEQLEAERAAIVACVGEADFAEGVRAFIEKRSPSFSSTGVRD